MTTPLIDAIQQYTTGAGQIMQSHARQGAEIFLWLLLFLIAGAILSGFSDR